MAEPKNPALAKLREWPMFRAPGGKRRKVVHDGRAPPRISELVVAVVPGTPDDQLAWLRAEHAAGRLDGDDPDEIAEAEAMLAMLARLSRSRGGSDARPRVRVADPSPSPRLPAESRGEGQPQAAPLAANRPSLKRARKAP